MTPPTQVGIHSKELIPSRYDLMGPLLEKGLVKLGLGFSGKPGLGSSVMLWT